MARQPRIPRTPGATSTEAAAGAEQSAETGTPSVADGEGAAGEGAGGSGSVSDVPAKGARKGARGPLGRDDYLKMRAHEVDAKTLTKSVLTLDGWVVPDLPPVASQRA